MPVCLPLSLSQVHDHSVPFVMKGSASQHSRRGGGWEKRKEKSRVVERGEKGEANTTPHQSKRARGIVNFLCFFLDRSREG